VPTETDDNSKSLLLAGLGRQCMCLWTISRSVIYQIPAGGTKNNKRCNGVVPVFSASVINLVESSDFRRNQLPILGNLVTCHLQIFKYQNLKVSCFALNQLLYCNFPVFLVLWQSFSLTYSFKFVLEFFPPGFVRRSNRCSSY
jgi:hypothetical protein